MKVNFEIIKSFQFIFIRLKNFPKYTINWLILWKTLDVFGVFSFITNYCKVFLAVSEHWFNDLVEVIIHYLCFFRTSKTVFGVSLHEFRVKGIWRIIFIFVLGWIVFIFFHYYGYFLQKLLIQLLDCELFLLRHVFKPVDLKFHFPKFELKFLNFIF